MNTPSLTLISNQHIYSIVVTLSLSGIKLFLTSWTAVCQASLFFTISQSLLKLMSTESVMPSNNLILCCPFFSCPQSFPASGSFPMSRLFASCSHSMNLSFRFSISPSNEYSGLISFRTDWVDLLAVYKKHKKLDFIMYW